MEAASWIRTGEGDFQISQAAISFGGFIRKQPPSSRTVIHICITPLPLWPFLQKEAYITAKYAILDALSV